MADEKNLDQDENLDIDEQNIEAVDYIGQIRKMQKNTVPLEKFNKVVADNKALSKAISDGVLDDVDDSIEDKEPTTKEKQKRQQELRDRLLNTSVDRSNLDIAKDAVELRDITIELDGPDKDPFLPKGSLVTVTQQDYIKAKNVADCWKHCIDYANGDSEIFTTELQRLTKDAMPFNRR